MVAAAAAAGGRLLLLEPPLRPKVGQVVAARPSRPGRTLLSPCGQYRGFWCTDTTAMDTLVPRGTTYRRPSMGTAWSCAADTFLGSSAAGGMMRSVSYMHAPIMLAVMPLTSAS